MREITRNDLIFSIRIGRFVLTLNRVIEEGGVEVLKRWLGIKEEAAPREKGVSGAGK